MVLQNRPVLMFMCSNRVGKELSVTEGFINPCVGVFYFLSAASHTLKHTAFTQLIPFGESFYKLSSVHF